MIISLEVKLRNYQCSHIRKKKHYGLCWFKSDGRKLMELMKIQLEEV